ncbi:hypothetical protein Sjap_007692 [Stephania japonica]|uniref:Uncharacterized protein n=1 Tax=Stephania japonica TaxID=461633 RepID=A0AAP0JN48_9MAGN
MPTFTAVALDTLLKGPIPERPKSSPPMSITTAEANNRLQWPSLYATPETAPLPDSPSPFSTSPSPYIVNHKRRRGPRLCRRGDGDGERAVGEANGGGGFSFVGSVAGGGGGSDCDDFFDPNETMSSAGSVVGGFDSAFKACSNPPPVPEFFDASEELQSEGSPRYSLRNMDTELHGIQLNLLMETEKRKQAEETLDSMRRTWRKFTERLSLVESSSVVTEAIVAEDEKLACNFVEELCRHIHVVRVVSDSISRELAKVEAEIEMESQIEAKNFEIARLCDRVRYYEAVNHEMSQRNQVTIELARHRRQRKKRRQRVIWGSIGAAVALGSAAVAWSFLPSHASSSTYSLDRDTSPKQ